MKHIYPIILLSIIYLNACTLSGDQENKLNNQLSRYIEAYNKSNTLVYTSLTDKNVVSYYSQLSDSAFHAHFGLAKDSNQTFFDNALNKETKKEGNLIQRKYSVEKYTKVKEINNSYSIFAVSKDHGNTWFFINEDDYFNTEIRIKRLFKQ